MSQELAKAGVPGGSVRIGWVLGWAVPKAWFEPLARAALPNAEHVFFPATPATLGQIAAAGHFDWLVGYSFGAQLLLAIRHARVALLAPVFAFAREENSGGRMARAQVKYLARWLRRDPKAALADFYARAGLDVAPEQTAELDPAALAWGLEQLETVALPPMLPAGWCAWCGADDPVLDAAQLHALVPAITLVPGATHHPAELIRQFARQITAREERAGPTTLPGQKSVSALEPTRSTLTASFSKAAPAYQRHAQVQSALAGWLAEWLPRERAGRALEVGAGPGVFTRQLTGWPGGVTATDISPEMCAAGRAAVPQADWRVMAAAEPLPGPWGWIFSSAMLQWATGPQEIFSAWRRQLAPGGRVLAALFASGSLPEWRAIADEAGPVTWRTPEEWRAVLAGAGLRVMRDATVTREFAHGTAREFLRSLHGVGAAPARQLTVGALRSRLAEYERAFHLPNGGVRATWVFYRFEAEGVDFS